MRPAFLATVALCSLRLVACSPRSVDLSAVRQYAETSAAASSSFATLADDYYQSCLRQREYAPVTVGGEPLSSEIPVRPPPPAGPSPAGRGGNDADCHVSSALAYRWQLENRALLDYVQSLGYVAGIDTRPKHLDALAAALHSSGIVQSDAVATAGGNLATGIVSELIAARARRSLYQIAHAAQHAGIGTFAGGLQETATIYRGELQREHVAAASYYTIILAGEEREFALLECAASTSTQVHKVLGCARFPGNGRRVSTRTMLMDEGRAAVLRERIRRVRLARAQAYAAIDNRAEAAAAYARAVGAIAEGNAALLKVPRGDLTGDVQAVQPYVSDLQGDVGALLSALQK
ncbi:MAG: hypothetical protein M1314_03485 [Firmicutes bacterium]|nr:hypothetical protein [Bacillota bacterium]